jgi:predicted alpha/beta superfamily hydrolase
MHTHPIDRAQGAYDRGRDDQLRFASFEDAGFEEWWQALPPGHHTIHGTVKLRRAVYSPQLGNTRRLWLRLPSTYFDTTRAYPVIVMHDGQNLFDEATSYIGQEWRVDETLLALEREGIEAIAVGVENAGRMRPAEYVPWRPLSRARRYVAFLTDTILPLVDAACAGRTLNAPDQRLVMGSSLGGVISLYAHFERPDVFGLCGAMSPSTVITKLIPYLAERPHLSGRIYVDNSEGDRYGCNGRLVTDTLLTRGYTLGVDLQYCDGDGGHAEVAWAARLPDALRFLLGGQQSAISSQLDGECRVARHRPTS